MNRRKYRVCWQWRYRGWVGKTERSGYEQGTDSMEGSATRRAISIIRCP